MKKMGVKTMTDVTIPMWGIVVLGATAIMGLYGYFMRFLIALSTKASSRKGNSETLEKEHVCPVRNPESYVTKDVCSQTQKTIHAEMRIITQSVGNTNKILRMVVQRYDEKQIEMTKHVDDKFEIIEKLLKKN